MTVFEGSPPSSQQNYCFDSRQGLVYVDGMTPSQGAKEMFAKNVLLSLVVLFVLTGCKILIEVPPGGKVITESGSYECNSGEICEIDIVDLFFNETFTAQPDPDYSFLQWKKRRGGLCGGKTGQCPINSGLAELHEFLMAILESDNTYSLEPDFGLSDTWARKADLPISSAALSSCVVDGKLYAFGLGHGLGPGVRSNRVEMYDPSEDVWTRKADMPTARVWATAGVINGKCYVVGGGGGSADPGSVAVVEEYDPQTDSWRTRSSIPQPSVVSAGAVVDGKMYVFGGLSGPSWTAPGSSQSFVYDPASDRWSTLAGMPTALHGMAAGAIDGYIYIVGGAEAGLSLTDLLQRYDPVNDRWTTRAKVPIRMSYASVSVYRGSLYVFGGLDAEDTDAAIASAYRYNPVDDEWTELTQMSTVRQSFASETIDGRIYVVGGRPVLDSFTGLVDVDQYTP